MCVWKEHACSSSKCPQKILRIPQCCIKEISESVKIKSNYIVKVIIFREYFMLPSVKVVNSGSGSKAAFSGMLTTLYFCWLSIHVVHNFGVIMRFPWSLEMETRSVSMFSCQLRSGRYEIIILDAIATLRTQDIVFWELGKRKLNESYFSGMH